MDMISECPLGGKCEHIVGDKLHRCAWLVTVKGQNPQTQQVIDQTGCAMSWLPVLLVDNTRMEKGHTAALESLRNELVKAMEPPRFPLPLVAPYVPRLLKTESE